MKLPRWAELARSQWVHRGQERPAFADEPAVGQESVWDYPRPPALVGDDRRVRVTLSGATIADTTRARRVLETSHPPTFYIPRDDVNAEFLVHRGAGSRCEWKGEATYWDVHVGDTRVPGRAWSYEAPFEDFVAIAGCIAFYATPFECFVDEQAVVPQPGVFYAGWITPELVGPFKGGPGSSGW